LGGYGMRGRASVAIALSDEERGVHRSVAELEADIAAFIDAHNENPKPYKWVKSADEILASVKRFCQKTLAGTSDSGD